MAVLSNRGVRPWTIKISFSRHQQNASPGTKGSLQAPSRPFGQSRQKAKRSDHRNITPAHEPVKRLKSSEKFEEALRIQTESVPSQLLAYGKRATSVGEVYAKAAADAVSKSSKASSDYLTGSTRQNRFMALCHANAMQIILFCMADFLVGNLWQCLLDFWRARRDSNSRPPNS